MNVTDFNREQLIGFNNLIDKSLSQLKNCKSEKQCNDCQRQVAEAFNKRGLIRYKIIDFAEAIDDYSKALEYDTSFASAYYNRGVVNYRMGCFEQALFDFEKAVELQPSNTQFKQSLSESRIAIKERKKNNH